MWKALHAIRRVFTPAIPPSLPSYPAASRSDSLLSSFFREPANYANQPSDRMFKAVGRPTNYDDWDWGRLVYCWTGTSVSVRVVVQGGTVISAELIDPTDQRRFAEAIEVLWERPGNHVR